MRRFFRILTTLTVVVALVATMPAFSPVTAAAEGSGPASDNFNTISSSWTTDRYEPDAFVSSSFDGGDRLQISIGPNNAVAQRPGAYNGVFYDTQGRQKALNIKNVYPWKASAKLYISDDMLSGNKLRRTDLWIVTSDNTSNQVTSYPIIGMRRFDPDDARNPNALNVSTIWRYWYERSETDAGWTDSTLPVTAGWHTLSIVGGKHEFRYFIDGHDIGGYSISADSYPSAVILQAFNFGNAGEMLDNTVWTDGSKNYSVYWDDFSVEDLSPDYIPVNSSWTDGQLVELDDGTWVQVGYNAFRTITAAINAASTGDEIRVAAGTYKEDVVVNKPITLKGAGMNQSYIEGPIGGSVNTLEIATSGATVDGFTITRAGNNPTDWNNTGINSQGVVFNGNNNTMQNCKVYGNRNGVYINNRSGNRVLDNEIINNRTGVQFCNRINGTVFTGNTITDNFTMGILFNFDGAGDLATNAPVTFDKNNISGNWYGEVKCRWTNSMQMLDLSKNWFGTTNITRSATEMIEPGYPDQIPVVFGGTATKPAEEAPIISGTTYTKVNAYPWYKEEAMTHLVMPDYISVNPAYTTDGAYVELPDGNWAVVGLNAFANLQSAVKAAHDNDTIKVFPGEYGLNPDASWMAGTPPQGGWYLPINQDGLTIQGVDSNGNPIAAKPGLTTELPLVYGDGFTANGNFSTQDLIAVFGDNVTITGLALMPKSEPNKTIELLGANPTVKYCRFTPTDKVDVSSVDGCDYRNYGGSLYINGGLITTDSNILIEDNYFFKSNITFDSADFGGLATIRGNTFNTPMYYVYGGETSTYSMIGTTSWETPKETDLCSVLVKDNEFLNLPDGYARVISNRMNGTFTLQSNMIAGNDENRVTYDMTAYGCTGGSIYLDTIIDETAGNSLVELHKRIGAPERFANKTVDDNWNGKASGSIVMLDGKYGIMGTDAFAAIADAVAAAAPGETISIAAGTYTTAAKISLTKPLTIVGDGDMTILTCTTSSFFEIASADVTIKELKFLDCINPAWEANGKVNQDHMISTIRVSTAGIATNLTIDNCTFMNGQMAINIFAAAGSPNADNGTNIRILNSRFVNYSAKGFYTEKMNGSVIRNCTFTNVGTDSGYNFGAAIDINLKYGTYEGITIEGNTFTGCGTSSLNGTAICVKERGTGNDPSYAANPAHLSDIMIQNNLFNGNNRDVFFGEPGKNNVGPTGTVFGHNTLTSKVANNTQTQQDASLNYWGAALPDFAVRITGNVKVFPFYMDSDMTQLSQMDEQIWVDDSYAAANGNYITLPNGKQALMGTNAFTKIQDAVKAVAAGQTIKVLPGNYPVTYNAYNGGNWYLYVDKDNVTIMGVDATGVPITGRPAKTTELPVIYGNDYTGNGAWGTQSMMIVTGDSFTLQGVEVMPKLSLNKAIEISGDDSTIKYCRLSGNSINPAAKNDGGWDLSQDFGALYFNTDAVTKYTVDHNYLLNGCIAISNGTGLNGSDSGRRITNNVFDTLAMDIENANPLYKYTYFAIGFRGSDACGWREKDVGGAVIQGNSFINSNPYGTLDNVLGGTYIISTGKRDGGTSHMLELDWSTIIANNTFDNGRGGSVAYVKGDTSLIKTQYQEYGYWINVSSLAPTISAAAARAEIGDTVVLDTGKATFETSKSNMDAVLGASGMDVYFEKGAVSPASATKLDAFVQNSPLYNSTAASFALDGALVDYDGSEGTITATTEDLKVSLRLSTAEAAQVGDFTRAALVYYDAASDSFKKLPCTYDAAEKTLTFDTKYLTTYAVVKYTQDRSFKLEPMNVNSVAAAADTGIGVPSTQSGALSYSLKTGTLYAISGKATNMTDGALTAARETTITVTSVAAPTGENFKVFHWAERGLNGSSAGLWIPLPLTWVHTSGNQYVATLQPNALNYGDPIGAGAMTDGPFAFKISNAAVISIDSIVKSGDTILSNEMVQTITVNPEQNSSFRLESADVNATAADVSVESLGKAEARPAGTSYTLQTGKLYAISGQATNMTTGPLGGLRYSSITVTSTVAPESSNFKAFHWADKGRDGHSAGLWIPVTLTWERTGGLYEYKATLAPNALNYGEVLVPGQVTDGPFAFTIDNPGTVTVRSIIKDASGNTLSSELVQNITVNADANANLATLSASAGALVPGFDANTTRYKVTLDKDTGSTTLSATTQSRFASLFANGARQNTSTVTLLPGQSTWVWFLVIPQDATAPAKVYSIEVERAKDDNANLGDLKASTGTFNIPFSAAATSYNMALTRETTGVTITAQAASEYASVAIDGTNATSKQFTLSYGESKAVTVRVTAQNGSTKDYTVNITRANFGSLKLSTIDSLSRLPFGGVGLNLYSDQGLKQLVGSGVTDASGVATFGGLLTADYWVKVTSVPTGYYLSRDIIIKVSAVEDKTTSTTLELDTANMVKGYQSWQLRDIQTKAGTLSPKFDPDILKNYTLTLDENTRQTVITPVLADSTSKLYINGSRVKSKTVTLKYPGSTYRVSIRVLPKTGKSHTYYMTVVRSKSSNAYLNGVSATRGKFSPAFNKDTLEYTLNLTNTQSSTYITPKLAGYRASYKMYLDGKRTYSRTVSVSAGKTRKLEIKVTAQNGATKTYTIHIVRAISSNASLKDLDTTRGILDPDFNKDTLEYTLALTSAQSYVNLYPRLADSTAKYIITSDGARSSRAISIGRGQTKKVEITVTAQDGTTKKTYRITITRAA